MKIFIDTQILTGNLGDGWTDYDAVAQAFATYLEDALRQAVCGRLGNDIEIDINISIDRATGCGRELTIYIENAHINALSQHSLERYLQDLEGDAWEKWSQSPEAEKYCEA